MEYHLSLRTAQQWLTESELTVFHSLPNAKITAPREGDAGYDLYTPERVVVPAAQPKNQTIPYGDQDQYLQSVSRVEVGFAKINTGIRLAIPRGFVGVIMDKSSVGGKQVKVYGGIIDSIYRGDVIVCLGNHSAVDVVFEAGQKIAQLLLLPVYTPGIIEVDNADDLGTTERGVGGFGSTGQS